MRMVTADNLSYVSVRTSKVLVVKLPKNLIFDSQKGVSRGFPPPAYQNAVANGLKRCVLLRKTFEVMFRTCINLHI